jgi:hypothetical protein
MMYIVESSIKSRFQHKNPLVFSTSEQGVMAQVVEVAQTVLWLHENCRRLLEFSTEMTFHTQLGGMFLVYIPHVLHHMK